MTRILVVLASVFLLVRPAAAQELIWNPVPPNLVAGAPLPAQTSCGGTCYAVIPQRADTAIEASPGFAVVGVGVVVNDWSRSQNLGAVQNAQGEWYWAQALIPPQNYAWIEQAPGFTVLVHENGPDDYTDDWGIAHHMVIRWNASLGSYLWTVQP